MALSLFTINRWNTTPHIELITEASNSGFSLHVALLLAHESGESVDYEKLIKFQIFPYKQKTILKIPLWNYGPRPLRAQWRRF